ncbi:MAG: helix-turn-helix domain-containing protein [Pseudomonadota bacterium]
MRHNRPLTREQRYPMEALLGLGIRQRAIAQQLGVHPSSISRELQRNGVTGDDFKGELIARSVTGKATPWPAKVGGTAHPEPGTAQAYTRGYTRSNAWPLHPWHKPSERGSRVRRCSSKSSTTARNLLVTSGLHTGCTIWQDTLPIYVEPGNEREENIHGVVPQYLPKDMDFTKVGDQDITRIERQFNNQPRKPLGYRD